MESETTVRWTLRGRVQHIGFRWYTRSVARQLGISGWVRNRADGSVEVEAAGESGSLAEFKERLRRGPTGAVVSAIDEETVGRGSTEQRGFEILR